MKLQKLTLKNFRNHVNLVIELDGHSKIIRGVNGAGKSNILEAIHLISTTKSLRTRYDRELINHDEAVTYIEVIAEIGEDETKLEMVVSKENDETNISKKLVKINKVKKSLYKFAGTLNSVLFTPTDLELVTGTPGNRRKYIDSIFFQVDHEYKNALRDYTKALRHRNKVLEMINETGKGRDQLGFWTTKILEEGTKIQQKRKDLFHEMETSLPQHLEKLHEETTNISLYKIQYVISTLNEKRLEQYAEKEIFAKNTLIGPHKDDFVIKQNDYDLAAYGSRGQQRTAVLGLKLSELDFIAKMSGRRPILLLDDIYSELDEKHQEAIDNIVDLQQTLITTATNAQEANISIDNL